MYYLKLTYFLYQNLTIFSDKNYKKQAQMFHQNHSLVLHTVEIFLQFNFMKSSEMDLNNLELSYWAWINFMMCWT